jgi:DNA polymerase-3 subunit alpha
MFIHLRVHSAYSLAEGAIKVEALPHLCLKHNMPAVGITDTNNLFGALEIASTCKEKGLQALIGVQIDFEYDDFVAPLILFAKNEEGYENLLKLVSSLYAVGKDLGNIKIDLKDLRQHFKGLICLTGGHIGPVGKLILKNKSSEAKILLQDLQSIFQDNLYIEIQRHELEEERITEPYFLDFAFTLNIGIVATNNVFFESEDMYEAHDALLCIAEGKYVVDDNRRRETPHHFFKSSQQMEALFKDLPEAIENTIHIAKRIHYIPKSRPPILPPFLTNNGRSEFEELSEKSYAGLEKRLNEDVYHRDSVNDNEKEDVFNFYKKRLEYELEIIKNMGFPGYFLIVADFIQWAKEQGIPVGPGRGSGAGSLVAWALTITDMDPIYFGLIFERFLNPERVSMPDFDIDFCQERRDEVIVYVTQKYGLDHVAHIITFGKLQARAVLRDVGRVLQIPYGQVGKLCDLVPNNPANPVTLEQALDMEPLLQKAIAEEESISKLFFIARQLEGLNRHASTHAAGVVIGDRPLHELVPLYRDEKSQLSVTQFNMKMAEKAGLVKFDFLGLKTLTVIECASAMIRKHHDPNFLIQKIPLDDQRTFDLLGRVETVGIFQLESGGMKDVLKRLKPDRFEDLIGLVALYRPGPMDDIPRYLACKHGEEKVTYSHPQLEQILSPTYGVMVYQEQVMQIAQALGGYSLGSADLLRRAMGKKIKEEMDAQRHQFVKGAVKNGTNEKIANQIFDQMAKFAGYGFNKSHSAPYALLAYQTAFLKANYPLEFFSSSMTYDLHNTEKLNIFRQDIEDLGYVILPPDINESYATFWVDLEKKAVRYALAAIKNVGLQAVELLVQERLKNGKFKSLDDFIQRIDLKVLNKRLLEKLIMAGAFDCLHQNRQQLFHSIDIIVKQAQSYQDEKKNKQTRLFMAPNQAVTSILLPEWDDFHPLERLQNEFLSLGYYLAAHPLDVYKNVLPTLNVLSSADIAEKATISGIGVSLAGVLLSKQEKTSKMGNKFAFIKFSDTSGIFESALFSEKYTNLRDLLEEGRSFLIDATLKKDPETEEIKIMINNLTPLELAQKGNLLHLDVTNNKNIDRIIVLLKKQPKGDGRVVFYVQEGTFPAIKIEIQQRFDLSTDVQTHLLSLANL